MRPAIAVIKCPVGTGCASGRGRQISGDGDDEMANEKKSAEKSTSSKRPAADKSAAAKAASGSEPPKAVAKARKTPSPKTGAGKAAAAAASAQPGWAEPKLLPPAKLQAEIRLRAYEIYRERGGHHGSHEADWLRAEREVRAKYE